MERKEKIKILKNQQSSLKGLPSINRTVNSNLRARPRELKRIVEKSIPIKKRKIERIKKQINSIRKTIPKKIKKMNKRLLYI